MSKITEHNIEELMFDYVEGNLSSGEKAALENFIQENPEYAKDLEAWKQSFVTEPEKDYPLADELLAGSKGSIWMKWGLGLLLLGGSAVGAWLWMGDHSISENETALKDTEQVHPFVDHSSSSSEKRQGFLDHDGNGSANGSTENTHEQENPEKADSNGGVTASSSWNLSKFSSDHNRGSGSGSGSGNSGTSGSDDANPSPFGSSAGSSDDDSYVSYTEPVPEISPYEVSGGYGSQGYVFDKLALFEAMDYFEEKGGANANRESYDGTMDDVMEKQPTSVYRESFITKFVDKLAEQLQQPLGLTNLNDQYFILPDYHSPLYYNSAFAGGVREKRLKVSSRARWMNSDNTKVTGSVVYDDYIEKWQLGIGGSFRFDDFENGMYRNYSAELHLSPKFRISRYTTIEPAVGISFNQREVNWNKITPGRLVEFNTGRVNQSYMPTDTIGGGSKNYLDFNAGILLNTKYFYAGLSMGHLLRPDVNVYSNDASTDEFRMQRMLSVQIGSDYQYRRDGKITMSPQIIYNQIGNRSELWFGAYTRLDWFLVGGSLSNRLDYVGMIGIQGRGVRIAYNFDMTRSSLTGGHVGSHSISARFIINRMKRDRPSLQYGLSGDKK